MISPGFCITCGVEQNGALQHASSEYFNLRRALYISIINIVFCTPLLFLITLHSRSFPFLGSLFFFFCILPS
jgi:hypothetical protein